MYEAVRSDVAKDYWDEGKCETPGGAMRSLGTVRSMAPERGAVRDSEAGNSTSAPATRGISRPRAPLARRSITSEAARTSTRMRTVVQF